MKTSRRIITALAFVVAIGSAIASNALVVYETQGKPLNSCSSSAQSLNENDCATGQTGATCTIGVSTDAYLISNCTSILKRP